MDLSDKERQKWVDHLADTTLAGRACSICGREFTTREEKDSAVVTGEGRNLSFAHEACFRASIESRIELVGEVQTLGDSMYPLIATIYRLFPIHRPKPEANPR